MMGRSALAFAAAVLTGQWTTSAARKARYTALRVAASRAVDVSGLRSLPPSEGEAVKTIAVGNPGSGKSAILNSLIGDVAFHSGVSIGSGLTYQLDRKELDGHIYMDTPGLSDEHRRKEAADAITQAFNEGGRFKVLFVITLESGRLRPADKATIKVVLDSAPIEHYGIIVNKVTPEIRTKLVEKLDLFGVQLFQGMDKLTEHFYLNPFDQELLDKDDRLGEMPPDVRGFIEKLPTNDIASGTVQSISPHALMRVTQECEDRFAKLNSDPQHFEGEFEKLKGVGKFTLAAVALVSLLGLTACAWSALGSTGVALGGLAAIVAKNKGLRP